MTIKNTAKPTAKPTAKAAQDAAAQDAAAQDAAAQDAAEYTTTAQESESVKASAEAYAIAGRYSRAAAEHIAAAIRPHCAIDGQAGNYPAYMAVRSEWCEEYIERAAKASEHGPAYTVSKGAADTAWSRLMEKAGLSGAKPSSKKSSKARTGTAGSANARTGNPRPKRDAEYYRAEEAAAKKAADDLTADAEKARAAGNTKSAERITNKAAAKWLEAELAAKKAIDKELAAEHDAAEKAEKAEKAKAEKAAETVRAALADKDTAAFLVECLNHRATVEAALKAKPAKPTTTGKARSKPSAKPTATPADPATWSAAV